MVTIPFLWNLTKSFFKASTEAASLKVTIVKVTIMDHSIQCNSLTNNRIEYLLYDPLEIFVIGRAICTNIGSATHVNLINVNHGFRGQGYGSQLLDAIITNQGHKILTTDTWNHLVPWYSQFGFRVISHQGNIFQLERAVA